MQRILVDGNNLAYRALWINRQLTAPDGKSTGLEYGFLRSLFTLHKYFPSPTIEVVFDHPVNKKKHERVGYKAKRTSPDREEVYARLAELMKVLIHLVPVYQVEGCEADDVIACLCSLRPDLRTYIYSADWDYMGLVTDNVLLLKPNTKHQPPYDVCDAKKVVELCGVPPEKFELYRAILGDSSDNVEGVVGIGPKWAAILAEGLSSETWDMSYTEGIEDVPGYRKYVALLGENLLTVKDNYEFLHRRGLIFERVPVAVFEPDEEKVRVYFERQTFASLLKQLPAFYVEQREGMR